MNGIRVSRRRFAASVAVVPGLLATRRRGFGEDVCVLTAEQEEGPFYLDRMTMRGAIAEDRAGIPLTIRLVLQDSRTCAPLVGAAVDLWHCDAMGLYSGYTKSRMFGPPPNGFGPGGPPPGPPSGPPHARTTDALTFLRGIQLSDKDGSVTFETIFPGFYDGRTNHVHFKVRLAGERQDGRYVGGHTSHTGQLFFPEDWNVKLMAHPVYAAHKIHRTTQREDMVFNGQHGAGVVATLLPRNEADPAKGLAAQLTVAVDPTATPKPVAMGPPGDRAQGSSDQVRRDSLGG